MSVVRELYGVMAAERVAGGYVVTSGTFTKDAEEFAAGRNIELIDGKGLDALLKDGEAVDRALKFAKVSGQPTTEVQVCPTCKSPMVLRTAKKGSNAGGSFWGCSRFPKCRQIVRRG